MPTIYPYPRGYVTETTSLVLTCISHDSANTFIYWRKDGILFRGSAIYIPTCQSFGDSLDPSKYNHSCYMSNNFSLIILNIQRQEHGVQWSCEGDVEGKSDYTESYVRGICFTKIQYSIPKFEIDCQCLIN